jgi:hypothetical protein
MNTDYLTRWLVCFTEIDVANPVPAGDGVQPIPGQEASPDVQGANVQVCSNECTNNKIIFRTFRNAKKHCHAGKIMTVTLQGRETCFCNKPLYQSTPNYCYGGAK